MSKNKPTETECAEETQRATVQLLNEYAEDATKEDSASISTLFNAASWAINQMPAKEFYEVWKQQKVETTLRITETQNEAFAAKANTMLKSLNTNNTASYDDGVFYFYNARTAETKQTTDLWIAKEITAEIVAATL